MYACPLCPKTLDSDSYSPTFATVDSLSAHIDSTHCPITGSTKLGKEIKSLENQIRNFANSQIQEFQQIRRHKLVPNSDLSFNQGRVHLLPSSSHDLRHDRFELLNFPKDYEYVKLENDYLKGRLRELERNSLRDQRAVEDRNFALTNDVQKLTSFLKDTQRVQRKSKRNLQNFLSNLLSDLEDKEKTIAELNKQLDEEEPQVPLLPNIDYSSNVPVTEELPRIPTKISLRTRKFSGQSIDSGYQDGTDSVGRKLLQSASVPTTKTAQPVDLFQGFVDFYANQQPGPSRTVDGTTIKHGSSNAESVLGRIFWYLDTLALLKCTTVCRQWRKIAENPVYWKRIYISDATISDAQMNAITNRCSQTTSLTMKNIEYAFTEDESPIITKGILEKSLEKLFRSCSTYLTFLKIADCCPYLTDRTLWLLSCHCQNIKQIIYISKLFPVSAPVVWSIGASCRQVETFVVPSSKRQLPRNEDRYLKFDDNCLLMVARCWPTTLKQLSISGRHITVAGLSQIAEHCKKLETFEIENFSTLSLSTAQHLCKTGWTYLKTLHFLQTKIVAEAVLWLCEILPNIEKILISWKTVSLSNHSEVDDYLQEIFQLQKIKETNPAVDKIVRIMLQR